MILDSQVFEGINPIYIFIADLKIIGLFSENQLFGFANIDVHPLFTICSITGCNTMYYLI